MNRGSDHQKASPHGQGCQQIERALEHLAIANRPGGAAVLAPGSRAGDLGPAELISGSGDRLIRAAGSAMEQGVHQAATGGTQEMGGNQL